MQAKASRATVIIVGTHWDKVPRDQRAEKEKKWKEMITSTYASKRQKSRDYPKIEGIFFVGSGNIGIEDLMEGIYNIATDMDSPEGTVSLCVSVCVMCVECVCVVCCVLCVCCLCVCVCVCVHTGSLALSPGLGTHHIFEHMAQSEQHFHFNNFNLLMCQLQLNETSFLKCILTVLECRTMQLLLRMDSNYLHNNINKLKKG